MLTRRERMSAWRGLMRGAPPSGVLGKASEGEEDRLGKGREGTREIPGVLGGVNEDWMEMWGGGRSGKDELEVVEEVLKTDEGREVDEETREGGRAEGEGGGLLDRERSSVLVPVESGWQRRGESR